jgi:RNA polymerase sigma-70 factor (ECF subfamily)
VAAGLSDEQLLTAARAGDSESFGVLVTRWEGPLYRFVYRLLPQREDARDVCQEAFLRVYNHSDRFRPGSRFSTWLYQIALNLCRDHQRRRQRWNVIVASGAVDRSAGAVHDDGPAESAERRDRAERVHDALERIPREQREVLVLKEFEGLKFREIADLLGCPESTVKSRLYYGLDNLRAELDKHEAGPPGPGRAERGSS